MPEQVCPPKFSESLDMGYKLFDYLKIPRISFQHKPKININI